MKTSEVPLYVEKNVGFTRVNSLEVRFLHTAIVKVEPGLVIGGEGCIVAWSRPSPVVHNHSRQVVQAAAWIRESGAREVIKEVARHIEAIQRKLYVGVNLGSSVGCPSEPFNM